MIPYGRQHITDDDIKAVTDVLRSDFLTQGPCVPRFEEVIANYCGAKYAVAANSATSLLHLACLALDLGKGDSLWTTPITFVASANCALYCGADVGFVDIDPKTYNMCPVTLEKKLILAEKAGKLPKIVIPVHLCGQSCDMEAIYALSQKYGFKIIEDAAHAIGGKYKEAPIGNCRYSDITVFSFHPVKIITTGEGGVATTNDPALAERMTLLRSHGITRNPKLMTHEPDGPWYYQQVDLGFNYRMTDIHAALGLSQMQRLDNYVPKRHELAKTYDEQLVDLPVTLPWQHPDSYSAFHLYPIRVGAERHKETFETLRTCGISVNLHYIPVHTQPYYTKLGFKKGDFPNAEKYYSEAITIPLFPTITEKQQETVIQTLTKVLNHETGSDTSPRRLQAHTA